LHVGKNDQETKEQDPHRAMESVVNQGMVSIARCCKVLAVQLCFRACHQKGSAKPGGNEIECHNICHSTGFIYIIQIRNFGCL
jgi:hypothetical protein